METACYFRVSNWLKLLHQVKELITQVKLDRPRAPLTSRGLLQIRHLQNCIGITSYRISKALHNDGDDKYDLWDAACNIEFPYIESLWEHKYTYEALTAVDSNTAHYIYVNARWRTCGTRWAVTGPVNGGQTKSAATPVALLHYLVQQVKAKNGAYHLVFQVTPRVVRKPNIEFITLLKY